MRFIATFIETERAEWGQPDSDRSWYLVSGTHDGFDVTLDGVERAITRDGEILDNEGCPLTPGNREYEALVRTLTFVEPTTEESR